MGHLSFLFLLAFIVFVYLLTKYVTNPHLKNQTNNNDEDQVLSRLERKQSN